MKHLEISPAHQSSAPSAEPSDELAEAAGIMWGVFASTVIWTLIGVVIWLTV